MECMNHNMFSYLTLLFWLDSLWIWNSLFRSKCCLCNYDKLLQKIHYAMAKDYVLILGSVSVLFFMLIYSVFHSKPFISKRPHSTQNCNYIPTGTKKRNFFYFEWKKDYKVHHIIRDAPDGYIDGFFCSWYFIYALENLKT